MFLKKRGTWSYLLRWNSGGHGEIGWRGKILESWRTDEDIITQTDRINTRDLTNSMIGIEKTDEKYTLEMEETELNYFVNWLWRLLSWFSLSCLFIFFHFREGGCPEGNLIGFLSIFVSKLHNMVGDKGLAKWKGQTWDWSNGLR